MRLIFLVILLAFSCESTSSKGTAVTDDISDDGQLIPGEAKPVTKDLVKKQKKRKSAKKK